MPTPDMRPYAERLAKAMPERFKITEDEFGWMVDQPDPNAQHYYDCCANEPQAWAFWGPLADELKVKSVSVGTFDGDCHFVGPTDLLEAIAEAVCQEADRRTA